MSARLAAVTAAAIAVAAGLTSCAPAADESPSPSAPPYVDASPGKFEVAEVQAILRALPDSGDFAWEGGLSTEKMGGEPAPSADIDFEPSRCKVFLDASYLAFPDDPFEVPEDVVLEADLWRRGDGPGERDWRATAAVRVLDDESRGRRTVTALRDSIEPCADGYTGVYRYSSATRTDVDQVTAHEMSVDLPAGMDAVAVLVPVESAYCDEQLRVWAAIDNALIYVEYGFGGVLPDATPEDADALALEVFERFAAVSAGAEPGA